MTMDFSPWSEREIWPFFKVHANLSKIMELFISTMEYWSQREINMIRINVNIERIDTVL